ncbi:BREX-2 system phosphatase PglZ [Streptomyces sp. YIM 98790]|uniref:BREX-2 system phosphatase PglZ n=1 Tax=Streptomyces sp. YIM 98790 TaxID=2689077 RepID=UPI0014092436|nr:BREX-2 system phosphatase PglZ [Streptomyces sp. YIM 98790]
MAPRPVVGRRVIEALLETELMNAEGRRLLLVDAVHEESGHCGEFTLRADGRMHRVRVTDQDSALGIADAWQRHLAEPAEAGEERILVVTGRVPADQIGWDLRAQAMRGRPVGVDRADIVKQLFGAADLDPRMVGETWLLDAILDTEPPGGWPRSGTVVTRDHAVRALLSARLGLGDVTADTLDLDADRLFSWTRTSAGPAAFAALPAAQREGLTGWLAEAVGLSAPTLLALAAAGRGGDALPLGALATAVLHADAGNAAGFGLGALFGQALESYDRLPPFAEAADGVLSRWIAQAEGAGQHSEEARDRVLAVLDRADRLAQEAHLSGPLSGDRMLPSGYRARLHALADALDSREPAAAEAALRRVTEHQLAELHAESTAAARAAVRLVRWLAGPVPQVTSVAQGVREHLASWGWADRAVSVLTEGDAGRDQAVGHAYERLIGAVRQRRSLLDEQFAERLAVWAEGASQQAPSGALLIEDVLEKAAAPLAAKDSRPLILVLDGMSAEVAVQLADGLDRRVWTEIVPKTGQGGVPGRLAAVSMLPTVTRISRASLLSGAATAGGQSAEQAGFAAFWKKRHRSAALFHKGGYEGGPGHRLAPALLDALAGDQVVGVVLNTIDNSLASGREGSRTHWRLRDVAKLPDLMNAARDYGRPVLLVSDHGHVVDRTPHGHRPADVPGAESARWRTGAPGAGEVALAGPRVLAADGRPTALTAAWRDDLRYTARQAGYHGGASLAEVTVPVIGLVPSADLIPQNWTLLPRERTAPAWWRGGPADGASPAAAPTTAPVAAPTTAAPVVAAAGGGRKRPAQHGEGIFMLPGLGTTGERVVQTAQFRAQREFVRHAPTEKAVAAVIDALLDAGGKLSPGAVAAAAQAATGKSQRNPERFATVLERLLNIDGYPVLGLVDSGHTVQLNKALLEQQFLADRS